MARLIGPAHPDGMRQTIAAGDDLPQAQRDQQQPALMIRASSPAALLRLIPHLLGFVPRGQPDRDRGRAAPRPHPGHAPL